MHEDEHEVERDVEALIAERKTANRRHSSGREPVGTRQTRRLIGATVAVLAVATVVLAVVLGLSG